MSSTRPTRRNITAAEQCRLEEMERKRRINPDGSTSGRAMHEQQEERGQPGQEGGDNGHAARCDKMERLRAENRRLEDLTGELQVISEGPAGSTDDSDLVEAFLDFEKHAKVSSAGKAVKEQGFKKLGGVTNYEGWKKSYEQIVRLLVDKAANVNAQDGGYGNAPQAASYGGHEQVVELLVHNGAHWPAQDITT